MGRSTRRLAMPSPGRRGIGGAEEAADQVPAAVDAHLVEHDFEVVLHGVPGDVQGVGDAAGWFAAQDEGGDLRFAGGVCPESCAGLAGGSPVGVAAKRPRSWWPAEGET